MVVAFQFGYGALHLCLTLVSLVTQNTITYMWYQVSVIEVHLDFGGIYSGIVQANLILSAYLPNYVIRGDATGLHLNCLLVLWDHALFVLYFFF